MRRGEVDMELERAVERDFEREPGLHRRIRSDPTEIPGLRALLDHPAGCRCAPCAIRSNRVRAVSPPRGGCIEIACDRCYACGERAVGTRDLRRQGGNLERACARHADTFGGSGAP